MTARGTLLLSTRVDYHAPYDEHRDVLDQSFVTLLGEIGFDVLLMPNRLDDPAAVVRRLAPDGIVLSGGNDIDPALYGGDSSQASNVSEARDRTEQALVRHAIDRGTPLLGVCRGMQMINVALGGSLVASLKSRPGTTVEHVAAAHDVRLIEAPPFLSEQRERIRVNSYHDQGVVDDGLADCLVVVGRSDDGVIEMVRHPEHRILGIQWHPERPGSDREYDLALLSSFFHPHPREGSSR